MADIVTIRRGNNIYVLFSVKDQKLNPPRPLDPDGGVTIKITAPGGGVVVNNAAMLRVSKGKYSIQWQSTLISAIGEYIGEVATTHAGITSLTFPGALFNLQDPV